MRLVRQLFHGFLVGLAGLLPGLCGSTLLVLFGLYRPLTAALAHPFADFRGNARRFGLFFLAAGVGVLVGSRALAATFERHETATLFLFMGFMLGTLPDLFRQARRTGGHPAGWLAGVATLLLCLGLAAAKSRLAPRGEPLAGHGGVWLAAGAGIGLGSIIPGASVAFLLIYFGIYAPLLDGVARFDPRILGPIVLGAGAAILLFARAAHWFFQKAEGATTRGVLGLVVGSLALVYPGWPGGRAGVLCLGLLVGGFAVSALFNHLAPPAEPTA